MDNLFEILVPLVIAAIYFFGNMMSGKQDDDAPARPARRSRGQPEDPQAQERQRQVQEEIRRKIMERRRAASEPNGGSVETAPPPIRDLEERRHAAQQRRGAKETVAVPAAQPPELPRTVVAPSEGAAEPFSWDQSDNVYGAAMEAQLAQIEVTKRRAAALRAQTQNAHQQSTSSMSKTSREGRYFSGPIRSSLKSPSAARAAIIYSEILGTPISLRKGEHTVPGLSA